MDITKASEEINHGRHQFFIAMAMSVAAAQLGLIDSAQAQSRKTKPVEPHTTEPWTRTSFGTLMQFDAGLLNVGYAEAGPAYGPAVFLPHGWPRDIHSFVDVAPLLASAGYRLMVPYLREYTHRVMKCRVGHNLPQEATQAFAEAVIES